MIDHLADRGRHRKASVVRIALVFPEMLGTYGDGGNAIALTYRLRARGMAAQVVTVHGSDTLPTSCDIYLIGGSEDSPQRRAAERLAHGELALAVDRGAAVLAVCSALQLLGMTFPAVDGRPLPGVGLLPCCTTHPPAGTVRAVGDVIVRPEPASGLPDIVGFENHRARTVLEPGATPLGTCLRGYGNDATARGGERADGIMHGRLVGTYLHGPVLALNPALADLILTWIVGDLTPLTDPIHDDRVHRARNRRLTGSPDRHRKSRPSRWVRGPRFRLGSWGR